MLFKCRFCGRFADYGDIQGCIATYIDVLGVTQFMQNINRAQKEKPLNPKYERIRAQNESSSDGILNFLQERGAI